MESLNELKNEINNYYKNKDIEYKENVEELLLRIYDASSDKIAFNEDVNFINEFSN